MGRTLLTLALVLVFCPVVFGQTDSVAIKIPDSSQARLYFIKVEGKPAAWAKVPMHDSADAHIAPSQTKVLLAGNGGGDVAMEEMSAMTPDFLTWIKNSMQGEVKLKRCETGMYSSDFRQEVVAEFTNTYICEIMFPALDGSSKDPAKMTIKLDAEDIKYKKGDGSKVNRKTAPVTKKWQASNFKFELGDLPCLRVSKVTSLTWKQSVAKDEVGSMLERRSATIEKTRAGGQNIKITMPMSGWDAWERKMSSSLLSPTELLQGSITVMSPDRTTGYSLNLHDVSIVGMEVDFGEANLDKTQTFVVELHYNETDFNFVSR